MHQPIVLRFNICSQTDTQLYYRHHYPDSSPSPQHYAPSPLAPPLTSLPLVDNDYEMISDDENNNSTTEQQRTNEGPTCLRMILKRPELWKQAEDSEEEEQTPPPKKSRRPISIEEYRQRRAVITVTSMPSLAPVSLSPKLLQQEYEESQPLKAVEQLTLPELVVNASPVSVLSSSPLPPTSNQQLIPVETPLCAPTSVRRNPRSKAKKQRDNIKKRDKLRRKHYQIEVVRRNIHQYFTHTRVKNLLHQVNIHNKNVLINKNGRNNNISLYIGLPNLEAQQHAEQTLTPWWLSRQHYLHLISCRYP
ncbi:unnamed protein product [Didymodactylos carnosus]|uniref:Uncharacterized protein n=1 Tax=Didymodactylos carnosus TaxID=1234261 RepID=A0A815M3U9_9BILA|nr:unnamed protein product [Didymodactylos carnosus]CAF4302876.1 unnamed protein product [Didymodactylos carnosus]